MVCLSEQIWKLLLKTKVTVTAEYPRNALNKHGDIESCCKTFSRMEASPLSAPKALHENGKAINRPLCFQDVSPASNICSRRIHPNIAATNAFSITWNKEFYYAFPSFCLLTQVLNKIKKDKTKQLILITPCWQTQLCYPQILSIMISKPVILPLSEKLLTNPSG